LRFIGANFLGILIRLSVSLALSANPMQRINYISAGALWIVLAFVFEIRAASAEIATTLDDYQLSDAHLLLQKKAQMYVDAKEGASSMPPAAYEACSDVEPPDSPPWIHPTCALQLEHGKCDERREKQDGYCQKTCGLCADKACSDVEPPDSANWIHPTCALQLEHGKCDERREKQDGYCQKTCGLCTDEHKHHKGDDVSLLTNSSEFWPFTSSASEESGKQVLASVAENNMHMVSNDLSMTYVNWSLCNVSFHSNLGGLGPDTGEATLRYHNVTTASDGRGVDLVVTVADGAYEAKDITANGLVGGDSCFGAINLKTKKDATSSVDLLFSYYIHDSEMPVTFDHSYFTMYDMDTSNQGTYESVTFYNRVNEVFVHDGHTMNVSGDLANLGLTFQATDVGTGDDNPTDAENLTSLQQTRAVTVDFLETSQFRVTISIGGASKSNGGRNFAFAGHSNLAPVMLPELGTDNLPTAAPGPTPELGTNPPTAAATNCKSGCGEYGAAWEKKCTWAICEGCAECQPEGTTTTAAHDSATTTTTTMEVGSVASVASADAEGMLEESYSGDSLYMSATLANNGKIYAPPKDAGRVLEIDPSNVGSTELATSKQLTEEYTGAFLYGTSVLAGNGKIYAAPCRADRVLEIDPHQESTGGDAPTSTQLPAVYTKGNWNNFLYLTSVVAENGKIYAAPVNAGQVLEIDPTGDEVTSQQLPETYTGQWLYLSSVLANNGKIYAPPNSAGRVLEIDPTGDQATSQQLLKGDDLDGKKMYMTSVLAGNGKIYCAPHDAEYVLEIDPTGDEATYQQLETKYAGVSLYITSAIGGNGKIYAAPLDAGKILEIDPTGETVTTRQLPQAYNGLNLYSSSVTGPNGKIYAIPSSAHQVLEIDATGATATSRLLPGTLGGIGMYAPHGSVLANNGKIYAAPLDASRVFEVEIEFIEPATEPTPLQPAATPAETPATQTPQTQNPETTAPPQEGTSTTEAPAADPTVAPAQEATYVAELKHYCSNWAYPSTMSQDGTSVKNELEDCKAICSGQSDCDGLTYYPSNGVSGSVHNGKCFVCLSSIEATVWQASSGGADGYRKEVTP